MKRKMFRFFAVVLLLFIVLSMSNVAFADTEPAAAQGSEDTPSVQMIDQTTESKTVASAIAIGLAACGGAIGMGIATAKSVEGISRQPEAESKIRTTFMLGLVFIETAIIYALLVVILIIFVI